MGTLVAAGLGVDVRAIVLRAPPVSGYVDLAPRLKMPTLFIVGEASTLVYATNKIPTGSAIQIIERGGHLFEEEDVFEKMVNVTTS